LIDRAPVSGLCDEYQLSPTLFCARQKLFFENGKMERWYKTVKGDCIRVKTPLSLEDARRIVAEYVLHYNEVRLHSAIGYVTPADKMAGRERAIFAERDSKLDTARQRRRAARAASRAGV